MFLAKFLSHPLWLVGFRPFFALAMLSGMAMPLLWALMFSRLIAPPASELSPVQWHAHEMFFGFGWALLGGFLLTSTKNWVQVRGYHGGWLVFLAGAWLFERAGMWLGGGWPAALFLLSNYLFLAPLIAMILWTLIRHRRTDTYADNLFFILALPLFLPAKFLMLSPEHAQLGWSLAIGLFRLAFLIMLERTLSQFMKGVFQAVILRHPALDMAIKGLALVLVAERLLPPLLAAGLSLLLAFLMTVRFLYWKPRLAMRRLDIGIMHLGYLGIVLQLAIQAAEAMAFSGWVGAPSVHAFTFGVIGLIAPAMIVRISNGHTGRKVVFEAADKLALWLMLLAFVLRLVAPQALPALYEHFIHLAAACWFACFALLAWRYLPFLFAARIDGKEH
jgi:uncharacterized protein involved in response to NO